ncbi:hypothetical protein [Liquorilactobacillus vini]|uniref:hypothetical protein n=1 Tax=Liquorilactobacillus vini TaxID=238015 RepID=UPI00031FF8BD|nr:hypothetical protein [Liquorilactobacillus vini]
MNYRSVRLATELLLDNFDLAQQQAESYPGAYQNLLKIKQQYFGELETRTFEAALENLMHNLESWGSSLTPKTEPIRYKYLKKHLKSWFAVSKR